MKGDEVQELSSAMVQQSKQLDHSQIFLTSMARKCNIFFQTACTITPETLTEHLWKAQRIPQACTIHPELSLQQVQMLVERDWRMMDEQQRGGAIVWEDMVEEVELECNELQREIELCMQGANQTD